MGKKDEKEKKEVEDIVDFDVVLNEIGQIGPYQKWIYFLLCLVAIPSAAHAFATVFTGATLNHYCEVEGCDYGSLQSTCDNFSLGEKECFDSIQAYVAPIDDTNSVTTDETQCRLYSNASCHDFIPGTTLNVSNYKITNQDCKSWVHDYSQYESSTVSEWDLVCDRAVLEPISFSVYMVGVLIGAFVFGILADYIGRKPTMLIAGLLAMLFGTAAALSPNFYTYVAFRFMLGAAGNGLFVIAFVIGTELVGPDHRTAAGFIIEFFFSFGYMLLSIMAYFLRDWRALQLAISVPIFLFVVYIWLVPESPRWLLSKRKLEKAEVIIRKIAESNGTTDKLPDEIFNSKSYTNENKNIVIKNCNNDLEIHTNGSTPNKNSVDTEEKNTSQNEVIIVGTEEEAQASQTSDNKSASFVDLFRYPNMRKKTLNIVFNWIVNAMVYYGLSLNTSNLGGSDYLNAFISAAVEVPAYATSWWLVGLPNLGRRLPLAFMFGLAGLSCLITPFPSLYNDDLEWLTITFSMIGKFGISASFAIIYIFSAELYPTPIRSVGMGISSMFARIGSILAPLIVYMGDFWSPLPYLIFGVLSVIAGLLSLLLPETVGRPLPETIEQAEAFGKKINHKNSSAMNGLELENYQIPQDDKNGCANPSFDDVPESD